MMRGALREALFAHYSCAAPPIQFIHPSLPAGAIRRHEANERTTTRQSIHLSVELIARQDGPSSQVACVRAWLELQEPAAVILNDNSAAPVRSR